MSLNALNRLHNILHPKLKDEFQRQRQEGGDRGGRRLGRTGRGKQESQEASRLAVWKNSYQGQLAKQAKREYALGSIPRSSVDGASLLSDRVGNVIGGGQRTEKHRQAGM